MNIYIGHSTAMEYEEDLYRPLRESSMDSEHELVLPHDSESFFKSKKFLRGECDLFIAEVSEASTGLGIELGWAEEFGVPVICVHRKDSEPSGALQAVTETVMEYEDPEELVKILEESVRRMK